MMVFFALGLTAGIVFCQINTLPEKQVPGIKVEIVNNGSWRLQNPWLPEGSVPFSFICRDHPFDELPEKEANNHCDYPVVDGTINWYESQGKPCTLNSGASSGELNHTLLSAESASGGEGGLKLQADTSAVTWEPDRLDSIGGFPACAFPRHPELIETSSGKALHFNGTDQALLVEGNPLGNAKSFTIEVIFRPDSSANPGNYEQRFLHIMNPGHEENRILLELRLKKNQQWALDTYLLSGSSGLALLDTSLSHPAGRWYHVALVYDNGTAINYVDGVKELSGNVYYSPVAGGQTSIGVRQTQTSWFKGAIKSIRFTPHALEPSGFMKIEL